MSIKNKNPNRVSVADSAAKVGLYVATFDPGDGSRRYRFNTEPATYDRFDGIATVSGRAAALAFIAGYSAALSGRFCGVIFVGECPECGAEVPTPRLICTK